LVERLYLRELVTFKELELEFDQGLVVFSGPSGAGKSVLISAILASFGHATKGAASLCEVNLKKPSKLKSEAFLLEDEICIKTLKKEKLRYFIDGQSISRKVLSEMFSPYVKHLSVRDKGGMESSTLLEMIDRSLGAKEKTYHKSLKEYRKRYANYRQKLLQLEKIREDEKALAEKMEFARFEIEKIGSIDPRPGEMEELLRIKQQMSRIDKIREALANANEIFRFESSVEELYRLLDKDVGAFSEAMNQLRADFEESEAVADELEEIDVEEVLDRLSALTGLINRYGSIEEALAYRDEKIRELEGYEHIGQDKSMLEQFLQIELNELGIIAARISRSRKQEAKLLEEKLESYLSSLKLPPLVFTFDTVALGEYGMDHVSIEMNGTTVDTLSGGEFNRIRLALMAVSMPQKSASEGVLILDEIDANVSGDESIAIAEMIATLSRGYQVFAISHQPHLSAKATQHIVVEKKNGISHAKILDEKGRVGEIARIIGGEKPTEQAVAFARKLRA
jgi:DNA repair protein RecN (Recombination protein N)